MIHHEICFSCASREYVDLLRASDSLKEIDVLNFDRFCDISETVEDLAGVEECQSSCLTIFEPQFFGGVQSPHRPYLYIRGCSEKLLTNKIMLREVDYLHRDAICVRLRLSEIFENVQANEAVTISTAEFEGHHPKFCASQRGTLRRMWLMVAMIFTLTATTSRAISIDNEIIGDPDIECLEDQIRVWVKTKKMFGGRIYAKGKAEQDECFRDDFGRDRTTRPKFDLRFGDCGMKSLRSVDPRGMYYGITVVVSFHPLFITKVDQAYHVKCFFEEANKGLTAELGVSMIPTTELEARHGIPGCTYSIHKSSIDDIDAGRPAGPAVQFARVGDKVLHQWACNDLMYGVLINNCYVTDGFGKKADVIDDKGCPLDPILITGIRYSPDLQRAYAESSVFKFADKPGVWFFCQVQMCMKKHNMCKGVTPPTCEGANIKRIGGDTSEDYDTFSKQRASSVHNGNGKQSDYDYDASKSTRAPLRSTTPTDYEDYDKKDTKLHSPDSFTYKQTTQSADYDSASSEPVTVFGPAFNGVSDENDGDSGGSSGGPENPFGAGPKNGGFSPRNRLTTTSETVSQTFDTEDDLQPSPPSKKIGKAPGDYNDYDEVTIPPNLTDLLANLPDDLDSEKIEKILRDSVDDPKALLADFEKIMKHRRRRKHQKQRPLASRNSRDLSSGELKKGDKIGQIQVDWASARRKDSPLKDEDSNSDKPMIARQLLVFDLDEEPPVIEDRVQMRIRPDSQSDCVVSRGTYAATLASLIAVTAMFIVALLLRNRQKDCHPNPTSDTESASFRTQKRFLRI
ncbi:hypothetical protein WR25_10525 [Diploscapter pachys]|uniref:ZP domain-containing protein n=1 Tax=Diploscapter pachys TaxID=2018661 RepID=A0A2A2JYW8_9BILA|nr:hypothetical protein WR25_10525 [Diploscapter pachys]